MGLGVGVVAGFGSGGGSFALTGFTPHGGDVAWMQMLQAAIRLQLLTIPPNVIPNFRAISHYWVSLARALPDARPSLVGSGLESLVLQVCAHCPPHILGVAVNHIIASLDQSRIHISVLIF